jgi:diacylglycerol kinase family enzyme
MAEGAHGDDRRAALIYNPIKVDQRSLRATVTRLSARAGWAEPLFFETRIDDLGQEVTRAALAQDVDAVLVAGGDGTVRAVVAGLVGTGVPLGIIGRGTGNLLARNLDVPLETTAAIGTAFGGVDRAVDVVDVALGKGRHEVSTVMAGMGWDASMMAVSEVAKARLGWGAYAIQAARTVRDHPIRLRVQVDDGPEQTFFARMCLIANVGTLIGGFELLPESRPDDGVLEVLVFEPTTSIDYVRSSWGVVRGGANGADPARTVLRGHKVVITTPGSRPRQVDGDLIDEGHGFVARVQPGALTVRVPQR